MDWILPDNSIYNYQTLSEYVLKQGNKNIFVRCNILNDSDIITTSLEGKFISGNYSYQGDSILRRTCTLKFQYENGNYNLSDLVKGPLAPQNKIELWVGIQVYSPSIVSEDVIIGFKLGRYILSDPEVSVSADNGSQEISIQGLDYMSKFNGDVSGTLVGDIKYEVSDFSDTNPRTILQTMEDLVRFHGKENNILIARDEPDSSRRLPFNIEAKAGSALSEPIETVGKLYADWEYYYDKDGYFVFKPMRNTVYDSYVWDFSDGSQIKSLTPKMLYTNIRNKITVYGALIENSANTDDIGKQVKYSLEVHSFGSFDSDGAPIYPGARDNGTVVYLSNSPFTIEKVGARTLFIEESGYDDDEYAKNRAEKEMYAHQTLSETIDFECDPVYTLDVNSVIYFGDETSYVYQKYGVSGKYKINNIGCDLGSTMSINASKLYDPDDYIYTHQLLSETRAGNDVTIADSLNRLPISITINGKVSSPSRYKISSPDPLNFVASPKITICGENLWDVQQTCDYFNSISQGSAEYIDRHPDDPVG